MTRKQLQPLQMAAATFLMVALGGLVIGLLTLPVRSTPSTVPGATPATPPDATTALPKPVSPATTRPGTAATTPSTSRGWELAPNHGVVGRTFPVVVWTGSEVVVWGGEKPSEGAWHADGAAWDPVSRTWRDLAASPLVARSEHVAVWTGSEILVCCGRVVGEGLAAAAYDPTGDRWREIAAPPITPAFASAVWSGEEMIVFGGVGGGGTSNLTGAAAYEPASNTWRRLAEMPYGIERMAGIAIGDGVIYVWPSPRGGVSRGPLAYEIASDEWASLPPPPATAPATASLAWTGRQLFAYGANEIDSGEAVGVGLLFDPDAGSWSMTEPPPLDPTDWSEGTEGSDAATWGGDKVYVWTGWIGTNWDEPFTNVITYEPDSGEWAVLDPAPIPAQGLWHAPIIWTGSELVVYTDPMAVLVP